MAITLVVVMELLVQVGQAVAVLAVLLEQMELLI
jgi:hypothetical protein